MGSLFEDAKAVLFDLDGTVYHGSALIPGAIEAIAQCRDRGKRVFFLTNNSAKSREQIHAKLVGMGIRCSRESVITSGYAAGLHMRQNEYSSIYVCGTDGLRAEITGCGLELVGPDEALALLIGYDPQFDYIKLTEAVRSAINARTIIACNRERLFLGEGAMPFPGCGATVAAIEWSSGRTADYIVGKPNTLMLEVLCAEYGYKHDELVMIGDTYESDIKMADDFGCASVLIGEDRADALCVEHIGHVVGLIG